MTTEECKELWKQILTKLQPQMRSADFRTWFKNTAILVREHDTLTIGCPSDFVRTQLAAKHHDLLLKTIQEVNPEITHLDYQIDSSLIDGGERVISLGSITGVIKRALRREQVEGVRVAEGITTRTLNPDYTFNNFIVGAEDRIAQAAAKAVAERPGRAYNPLFIYGGVGLGKTHLLQAIGNEILRKKRERMIVYTTSEKFTNDVIRAIRGGVKKIEKFRSHYRQIDVLIVDDVQFFGNKKQTQEEFFHTFNVLREANKQIVLAADRPPRELIGIDDRLVSRFGSGMIADVYIPALETRIAILQEFAAQEGALIAPDILEFIAHNVQSSIRDLRGVMTQVAARIRLASEVPGESWTPTKENVTKILTKNNPRASIAIDQSTTSAPIKPLQVNDFIRAAGDYLQVDVRNILGSSRKKEVVLARSLAMWLTRNELKYGFEKIGQVFGDRNHATAMHAVNKIQDEIIQEPGGVTKEMINTIKKKALELK